MPPFLIAFFFLHVPALLLCSGMYFTGRRTTQLGLGRVLRKSAVMWLVVLWSWATMMILAMETCSGDMLFGYRNCSVLSVELADYGLGVFILLMFAALLFAVISAIIWSVGAWRKHKSDRA